MDFKSLKRRLWSIVGLALAAAVAIHGQQAGSQPYAGLTYFDRTAITPRPLHTHVIQVDLSTPGIRFTLTPPSGDRETERQTTVEFVKSQHAQAGINGHFFLPFPSTDKAAWLIGLAASEGRVFSAFESPEQSFALVADAPAINIERANRASIVHRDPSKSDGLHVLEPVELWTTIAGSAQIVTDGRVTIPLYKDEQHPNGVLTPGSPRNYNNAQSWYDAINARSAIGISRDGRTLTLFTVDAQGDSKGMTIGEAAAMLIGTYGVWNALNIDGGGSTSLVLTDPVSGVPTLVNHSSDNPAGRSVGSSLAVFAAKSGS
jgi:uncharacterized iron-regulated membrane protein